MGTYRVDGVERSRHQVLVDADLVKDAKAYIKRRNKQKKGTNFSSLLEEGLRLVMKNKK